MRRPRSFALALGVATAVLTTSVTAVPEVAAAPPVKRLQALHAEPDPVDGGQIVDAEGRQVLLRGVNVNALVDYWQFGELPTTFPLTAADADAIAGIGWNVVRLALSWSSLEPTPGTYDEAYLDEVAGAVDLLASRGVYTILDLHQDAWGPTLAAAPDESCPAVATPAFGWDGAPGWATLDGGAARCATSGVRELSPAVLAAFAAFWDDAPGPSGVGIQTRYVSMLGHLAGRFATDPAVAGYDVMNEPNAFGADQGAALSAFYERSLQAVRRAERDAGGHRHLFLFEPSALWSAIGRGAPPAFAMDDDVVYAPHVYTGGFTADAPITRAAFEVARDEADALGGVPVLSGEWGTGPDRAGGDGPSYFDDHQALQDEHELGATLWTWRESCGDPHKAADARAARVAEVWGLFEVDCRTNTVTGMREALRDDLARGYPRAAPGRLEATRYDPDDRALEVSGAESTAGAELVVFHPDRLEHRQLTGSGLRALRSHPGRHGGSLVTAKVVGGSWSLEVSPHAGPRRSPAPDPAKGPRR